MSQPTTLQPWELLFTRPLVDDGWLKLFRSAMGDDPQWLGRCVAAVEQRYRTDPRARDGFSRIGWALARLDRPAEAVEYFERDLELDRMQRWQWLRYLETLLGLDRRERAEAQVTAFYERHSDAVDGWATLAWHWHHRGEYDRAVESFERDRGLGRLTAFAALGLADSLARTGDREAAQAVVADAYASDRLIRDGYARVAGVYAEKGELELADRLFGRDIDARRISPYWKLQAAINRGRLGDFDAATSLIEESYSADDRLCDGFARLGGILAERRRWRQAAECCARDLHVARLTPRWKLNASLVEGRLGNVARARGLLEEAYACDPGLQDGFSRLAAILRDFGYFSEAEECFRRDHVLSRQSPGMTLQFAVHLVDTGRGSTAEASALVADAYAADSRLKDGFAGMAGKLETARCGSTAREYYERDLHLGRLSPGAFVRYADFLARTVSPEVAEAAIEDAYRQRGEWGGGYSALAAHHSDCGETEKSTRLFALDRSLGRSKPQSLLEWALSVVAQGNQAGADQIAREIPVGAPERAIYARLTGQPLSLGQPSTDSDQEALPATVARAALLTTRGEVKAAVSMIEESYRRNLGLSDWFSCAARAAEGSGKPELAERLFERDWRERRARVDSLLHFFESLSESDPRRPAVLDEALPSRLFPPDGWLTCRKNRFERQTCFILGTGPSLRNLDPRRLRGQVVFATNGAYQVPDLDFQFFVSVSDVYWRHHRGEIESLKCERCFLPHRLRGLVRTQSPTSWLNSPSYRYRDDAHQSMPVPIGFSDSPERFVFLGGSVIVVCLQIAFYLGFKRAVLLGVDHDYGATGNLGKRRGGAMVSADRHRRAHFVDNYYQGGTFHLDYAAMESAYCLAREAFDKAGRAVMNATPGTKLAVFPRIAL